MNNLKSTGLRIAGRLLARELNESEVREVAGGDTISPDNGNTNPTSSGCPCAEDDCGRDF